VTLTQGEEGVPTCQHAISTPPGVTTTRSSTAVSAHESRATASIACSSAATSAAVAGCGSW